jgi:hypothetical protein
MLSGCLLLVVDALLTFAGIASTTATAVVVGTTFAGVGVGLAFLGSFRMITAQADPGQTAGLVAAISWSPTWPSASQP